ncbi:uncharacterized protein BYT42DRAFT_615609 [Radiomyces spectabilis]|uniref:uncharacterized protein n=1 Tax=Radiomyces spectabilis TaxID=64574 RepID=UPI002220B31F|nr:uncharacterized protein BYT42DRAFT_615609 [Radiomyces spectabilis]KAI8374445.1 hypothetical protein BYT42DRAFT_615609 [Radiomyces spectabilis]
MKHLNKSSKTLDIRLKEEKFYFPGETIEGHVLFHPKTPTKANHLILRFSGQVILSIKEKDTIVLFQNTKIVAVSEEEGSKVHVLEAKPHQFPFKFTVPEDIELPSTMEFGKKASVRYFLTAILDRPMVLESLCPKSEFTIPILEYINIESSQYRQPKIQDTDMILTLGNTTQQCHIRAYIPRSGYTRGDIIPLVMAVTCTEPVQQKKAISVELMRITEIETGKQAVTKEEVLRMTENDINIMGPIPSAQSIHCKILIPTSTPPTIHFHNTTLRVHYKVRIQSPKIDTSSSCGDSSIDMPIVIGTWPRAAVPIDDDGDDNESLDTEMMDTITALGMDKEPATHRSSSMNYARDNMRNGLNGRVTTDRASEAMSLARGRHPPASAGYRSPVTLMGKENILDVDGVHRSSSIASRSSERSYSSFSSQYSNRSWDSGTCLSRNTSIATTVSDHTPSSAHQTPRVMLSPQLAPATKGNSHSQERPSNHSAVELSCQQVHSLASTPCTTNANHNSSRNHNRDFSSQYHTFASQPVPRYVMSPCDVSNNTSSATSPSAGYTNWPAKPIYLEPRPLNHSPPSSPRLLTHAYNVDDVPVQILQPVAPSNPSRPVSPPFNHRVLTSRRPSHDISRPTVLKLKTDNAANSISQVMHQVETKMNLDTIVNSDDVSNDESSDDSEDDLLSILSKQRKHQARKARQQESHHHSAVLSTGN